MPTIDQPKKEKLVGENVVEAQRFYGLSSEEKPAAAPNGSCFVEMDTSKLYFYNAAGAAWVEWGA